MARKTGETLKGHEKGTQKPTAAASEDSWAVVGVDTSMSSIAAVALGYDATLDKMVGPAHKDMRWYTEDDYFKRLGQAAKGHDLILDVLKDIWVVDLARVVIVCEEPWFFGAVKRQQSAWLKQQAEVSGSFKGSLARYGFPLIYEINNQQWKKSLREEGVEFAPGNKSDPDMKWKVKRWAVETLGLPDLPDLVKDRNSSKIPRPESGYGAKAKAIQPDDIYDAAALCMWGFHEVLEGRVF